MIGRTVGSYRITGKIGDGGMGSVFLAIDDMLGREVAIKVLHPELARQPEIAERFHDEAMILARLNHPNIATLYGLLRDGPDLFMAMEFIRGQTLQDLVACAGRLSWERASAYGLEILSALAYAHRAGVVHRDLKPANLMVTRDGLLKVMDFGIARVIGSERRTREGRSIGTLTYMAPEQIRGEEGDGRTDLYALGVVLYELVTGRPPFTGMDEYSLMQAQVHRAPTRPGLSTADLPVWVDAAILKAMAKDPAERFQAATAFRDAIERGLRTTPVPEHTSLTAPLEADEAKETRRASEVALEPLRPTAAAGAPLEQGRPTWALQRVGGGVKETRIVTVLARLNWRHYVAAAALFVSLAAAITLFAWSSGNKSEQPSSVATATEVPAAPTVAAVPVAAGPLTDVMPDPAQSEPPAAPPASPPERMPRTLPPAGDDVRRPPVSRQPVVVDPAPPVAAPTEVQPQPALPVVAREVEASPTPIPAARTGMPAMTFDKVKVLILEGAKSRERDAVLRLDSHHLSVNLEDDFSVFKELKYPDLRAATFSQSRHPRWKEGGALAIGAGVLALPVFFLKSTRHWLTIQTEDDFVVLRLDKNNYRLVIPALESRSGIKVDIAADDK
jgi:eukaryotic-like serine/threonine-protein kinase